MTDRENLLIDVLAEESPANLGETMLAGMLHQVRRKNRGRVRRKRGAVLAAVALLGLLSWRHWPQFQFVPGRPAANYELVRTHALATSAMVHTQPLSTAALMRSTSTVAVIETRGGQFRFISDNELLAFAGRSAVLVRLGPHTQILVLAD
jgi:predicted component of type VI protein secretion system